MKFTVEEQQKRSERARIKAYYARRRRKQQLTRSGNPPPKQKQGGFKNMRLIKKSSATHLEPGVPTDKRQGKDQRTKRKRAKLPPARLLAPAICKSGPCED
jgi:hypothetical protein